MSTQNEPAGIPEWDLADRLRKSLRASSTSVQTMADHLGFTRKTVGDYLGGRTEPRVAVLRVWAMRCGVPFEWLAYGTEAEEGGPDGGSVIAVRGGACTRWGLAEMSEGLRDVA